jgi:hypothetical protein
MALELLGVVRIVIAQLRAHHVKDGVGHATLQGRDLVG